MDIQRVLCEVNDLLAAEMNSPKCPPRVNRAASLVEMLLAEFFSSDDDIAALAQDYEDNCPF